MEKIPLEHFLLLAALLFSIGMAIAITKNNALMVLIGIELMLNAVNINFVAFSKYDPQLIQGQIFSIFVLVVAAAEATIALALFTKLFFYVKTLNLEKIDQLKE